MSNKNRRKTQALGNSIYTGSWRDYTMVRALALHKADSSSIPESHMVLQAFPGVFHVQRVRSKDRLLPAAPQNKAQYYSTSA